MDNTLDSAALQEIAKQFEGNSLALGASVEIMTELRDIMKAEKDAEATEIQKSQDDETQAAIVKDIVSQVLGEINKTLGKVDQGMPGLDGNDPTVASNYDGDSKGAGKGGASSADDSETPVNVDKDIKTQQSTIQASYEGRMDDDDEDDDEDVKKADDKSDKYPKDEDEPEDEMKKMAAQIEQLTKRVAGTDEAIEKAVTDRTAAALRKMGIVEANNLKQPTLIDNNTLMSSDVNGGLGMPLNKSIDGLEGVVEEPQFAIVDQLSKLSYHQMRTMEENLESGNTEGLPTEVINGFKTRRVG